jgi:G:T-mismatch repair DNA endonuclease (very short patch repair protein)/YHS domain-containing protein
MAGIRTGKWVSCHSCGKEIWRQKGAIAKSKSGYNFCSNECMGKFHIANSHYVHLKTGTYITCKICGKQVYRQNWQKDSAYCSITCRGLGRRSAVKRLCERCGKEITVHAYRLKKTKHFFCGPCHKEKHLVTKYCTTCGKPTLKPVCQVRHNKSNMFFCSLECQNYSDAFQKYARSQNTILPNKPEKLLIDFFTEYNLPYKYTGDGGFTLDGAVPDFVNVNGEKKIVEFFGDYWHGQTKTHKSTVDHENERKLRFKKFGYDTIIVWEHELKDKNWKSHLLKRINVNS